MLCPECRAAQEGTQIKAQTWQLNPSFLLKMMVQLHANENTEAAKLTLKLSRWYLILCISRKLLPREQNYLTVDKECQAIKRELEALKHTLIGRHLHLFSQQGCGKPDNPSAIPWMLVGFTGIRSGLPLLSKCLYLSTTSAVEAM